MGIDYIVHYDCAPKQALTLEGLMGRLKGRDRAQAIIEHYRDEGDQRPPSERALVGDGRRALEVPRHRGRDDAGMARLLRPVTDRRV